MRANSTGIKIQLFYSLNSVFALCTFNLNHAKYKSFIIKERWGSLVNWVNFRYQQFLLVVSSQLSVSTRYINTCPWLIWKWKSVRLLLISVSWMFWVTGFVLFIRHWASSSLLAHWVNTGDAKRWGNLYMFKFSSLLRVWPHSAVMSFCIMQSVQCSGGEISTTRWQQKKDFQSLFHFSELVILLPKSSTGVSALPQLLTALIRFLSQKVFGEIICVLCACSQFQEKEKKMMLHPVFFFQPTCRPDVGWRFSVGLALRETSSHSNCFRC